MTYYSGLYHIYNCPKCNFRVAKMTCLSHNTFGAKFYSDGFVQGSMFDNSLDIFRCKSCDNIFWFRKENVIGSFDWNQSVKYSNKIHFYNTLFDNMIPMDFLFALQQGLAKNDEDEIYIRIHMLWAFNHRQRDNKALFQSQNDKDVFEDNLKQLLKLLDDSETSLLLKAEIYRYLSQFDKSIELLKPLKSKNETAEILINACLDRNKKLIELV